MSVLPTHHPPLFCYLFRRNVYVTTEQRTRMYVFCPNRPKKTKKTDEVLTHSLDGQEDRRSTYSQLEREERRQELGLSGKNKKREREIVAKHKHGYILRFCLFLDHLLTPPGTMCNAWEKNKSNVRFGDLKKWRLFHHTRSASFTYPQK